MQHDPKTLQFSPSPPPPTGCLEGETLAAFFEQSTALVMHDFTLALHADHSALRSISTLYGAAKLDGYAFIEPTNGGDRCKETRAGTIVFYTHEVVLESGDAFKIVDITNPHPCKLVARVTVPNLCVPPLQPTNGQMLFGTTGNEPTSGIVGTSNQVTITPVAGTLTVSTPQSMGHHQSADHDALFWMDENGVVRHISQGHEQNKKKKKKKP